MTNVHWKEITKNKLRVGMEWGQVQSHVGSHIQKEGADLAIRPKDVWRRILEEMNIQ